MAPGEQFLVGPECAFGAHGALPCLVFLMVRRLPAVRRAFTCQTRFRKSRTRRSSSRVISFASGWARIARPAMWPERARVAPMIRSRVSDQESLQIDGNKGKSSNCFASRPMPRTKRIHSPSSVAIPFWNKNEIISSGGQPDSREGKPAQEAYWLRPRENINRRSRPAAAWA